MEVIMNKKVEVTLSDNIELPDPAVNDVPAPVKPDVAPVEPPKEPEPALTSQQAIELAVKAMQKVEEEKRMAEYINTPKSAFDAYVNDEKTPELVRKALAEESDQYLAYNPKATKEEAERHVKYIHKRFMETYAQEEHRNNSQSLQKHGWLHKRYGETSQDIVDALANSMSASSGLGREIINEMIDKWTPEQLQSRVDAFYKDGFLNRAPAPSNKPLTKMQELQERQNRAANDALRKIWGGR